jgi:hypothetical protein
MPLRDGGGTAGKLATVRGWGCPEAEARRGRSSEAGCLKAHAGAGGGDWLPRPIRAPQECRPKPVSSASGRAA